MLLAYLDLTRYGGRSFTFETKWRRIMPRTRPPYPQEFGECLEEKVPSALQTLENGFYEVTAVLAFPEKYRKHLWTTNMLERFIQETRVQEKVIRIFPNMSSPERLIGALCAETHEDRDLGFSWSTGRRYLTIDEYLEWRTDRSDEEVLDEQTLRNGELTARSATCIRLN